MPGILYFSAEITLTGFRFNTPDGKGELITLEKPITRFVQIKRHGLENDRRPVITMDARIGTIKRPTQFTLRSRENYDYPILVGVRFLESKAIVDVSREFVAEAPRRTSE